MNPCYREGVASWLRMRCDKHLERSQWLGRNYRKNSSPITFNTTDSETIDNVLSKPKWYFFRGVKCFTLKSLVICQMTILMETHLFKQTVKIYVDNISSICIQKNIFTVSIAEPCACSVIHYTKDTLSKPLPKDKPNHWHNSSCSSIRQSTSQPRRRFGEGFNKPFVKHRHIANNRRTE